MIFLVRVSETSYLLVLMVVQVVVVVTIVERLQMQHDSPFLLFQQNQVRRPWNAFFPYLYYHRRLPAALQSQSLGYYKRVRVSGAFVP